MEELLKEMKENLLGKEIGLLDLDNASETILNTSESLYEYFSKTIENKSFGYVLGFGMYGVLKGIIVEFEILDKNYEEKLLEYEDYKYVMKVKVINIYEF